MRICLLTRYFDFRNAGLGRVSREIRTRLEQRGHDVIPISTEGESLYSYFWYTFAEIRKRLPPNCDVYHAITPMEAMGLPKGRSIVTFHDLFQITHPGRLSSGLGDSGLKHWVGVQYFKYAVSKARDCRFAVAVSSQTQQDLVSRLGMQKSGIHVIRSGIRPDLDILTSLNGVGRLGYLGQLDRRKRVDVLIRAFRQSPLESLKIAGTGPEYANLRLLADRDPRIEFLGRVDNGDLVKFYNSIDVFVFPTWIEGYGLPVVEAMACGRPVIVLADAVLPTEVRERCVVVSSLRKLLSDPTELSRKCRLVSLADNYVFAKQHDWEKTVDEYERLYEEAQE